MGLQKQPHIFYIKVKKGQKLSNLKKYNENQRKTKILFHQMAKTIFDFQKNTAIIKLKSKIVKVKKSNIREVTM